MIFSNGFSGGIRRGSSEGVIGDLIIPLSNSIDSTSTNTGATSYAVKLTNDRTDAKVDEVKAELSAKIDDTAAELRAEDYIVKLSASDEAPGYLADKIDNATISIESGKLYVKSVKGLTIGVSNVNNWLSGTKTNIQSQLDGVTQKITTLTAGMTFLGKVETYADMLKIGAKNNGSLVVVLVDESRKNGRSMYVYSDKLGLWDFIGEFTFTDEFIELGDTPASYSGQDGKVVKVDEANSQLVFSSIDYAEIANKPASSASQIDSAVVSAHSHGNLPLIETYTQTNADLAKAVKNTHSHVNEALLDTVNVNSDGDLIVGGNVYKKYTQKGYLYVKRSANTAVTANQNLVFDSKINGTIPYNVTNGSFTLTKGKIYRITAKVVFAFKPTGWVRVQVIDSATGAAPTEASNVTYCVDTSGTYQESAGGVLDFIIIPTSTRNFYVSATGTDGASGTTYTLRDASNMVITEL